MVGPIGTPYCGCMSSTYHRAGPCYGYDHAAWLRLAAPTFRDRKIVHAPTKLAGNCR